MSTTKQQLADAFDIGILPPTTVLIMGAGMGGIQAAIAVKTRLGCEDFMIYEKASDIGGTWRANTYPGCSSDIPIHFYSLSTEPNSSWRASHGSQPEILAYWAQLTEKHVLRPHMRFGHRVVAADWDSRVHVYRVTLEVSMNGKVRMMQTTARVLMSAVGLLDIPRWPGESEIKGATTGRFKGAMWHSAQWEHGINLQGKRVAVIGNGSSASQFIPRISKDPSVQVTNFYRTPQYYVDMPHSKYSVLQKWIFEHVPFAMRIHRIRLMVMLDLLYLFWQFVSLREYLRKALVKHMLDTAPSEYHDKLMPNYPPGCKRFVADTGYLASLHQPNVSLDFDRVEEIVEDGIITKKGEHIPFDVIIFATGFTPDQYPVTIRGSEGHTIQEYYKSQEGPTAYRGLAVPGFPNFFIVGGPNTITGHSSVIFIEEVQINYMLSLIAPLLTRSVLSFSVTHSATDAYNVGIQARLMDTSAVWSPCSSWYRAGRSATGRVFVSFPGPVSLFWWYLRRVKWADWRCVVLAGEKGEKEVGAKSWVWERRARRIRVFGGITILIMVLWWVLLGRKTDMTSLQHAFHEVVTSTADTRNLSGRV